MEKKNEEKQTLRRVLLAVTLLLSVVGLTVSAYKFYNYSYALDSNAGTATWYLDFVPEGGNVASQIDGNSFTIKAYHGTATNVTIPATAVIDGTTYQTVVGSYVFSGNTTVKKVTFSSGVKAGTSLAGLFLNATNLESVTFNSDFDTSSVTNMSNMFNNDSKLKTLDLSMFNTSSVTNMGSMFYQTDLDTLNIKNFDTASVTNMNNMWCSSLKKIIIGDRMDFKVRASYSNGSFDRGMWLRAEDNKEYAAINIALENKAGTYTKVSNFIPEMNVNFVANYKIDNYHLNLTKSSAPSNFVLTSDRVYVKNLNKPSVADYTVDGAATLYFDDAVIDVNNNKYDLKIVIDNIHIADLNSDVYLAADQPTNFNLVLMNIYDDYIGMVSRFYKNGATAFDKTEEIYNGSGDIIKPGTSRDITISILNKSGNVVSSDGSFIFSAYDIDTPNSNKPQYSEGVNLLEGYDINTFKKLDNGFLTKSNSNRITGSHSDSDSELSEFIIKANANNFKFTWTGTTCGTRILSQYQPEIVNIEKQDLNGNVLAGAKFELYYGVYGSDSAVLVEDGSWTSTTTAKKFFLMPGYYTLREVTPPSGYKTSSNINFTVGEGGVTVGGNKVSKVVMKDTPDIYKYEIHHVDKEDPTIELLLEPENPEAPENKVDFGSKVQVKEKEFDGYRYDSKDKEEIIIQTDTSKNIAYVYYVKVKGDVIAEYRDINTDEKLTDDEIISDRPVGEPYETKPKEIKGYKLVEIKGDETGEIKEETQKVIYYYEKIKGYSPQTGDTRDIAIWVALAVISVIGIVTVVVYIVRRKK